jgi:long-chain acyl-CoA synthetase
MLTVQGRQSDLFGRPGGRKVSPGALETLLRSSHFVSHVLVVGEGRPYNVALIAPDLEALPRMTQRFGITATSVADVLRDPRVREHFDQDIKGFNDKLPAHEKIQAWHVLPGDFSVGGGELTPAGTLRRQAILEKFASEIDRLYAGQTEAMKGVAP